MDNGLKKIASAVFILAVVSLFIHARRVEAQTLTGYAPVFVPFNAYDGVKIAIRKFTLSGKTMYLVADAKTLDTRIIKGDPTTLPAPKAEDTRFLKAVRMHAAPQNGLQNHGIKNSINKDGVFLSVDLCPSAKPLEKGLFIAASSGEKRPVPVAIAISGAWLKKHRAELDWLVQEEREGRLEITWVNHSLTHPYDSARGIAGNFLLGADVDFDKEVLGNEVAMIEAGLTPSVFFRFPGLASDSKLLKRLGDLSLISVGADAWLAKGQTPEPGAIVLVHGNGNEPEGIKKFSDFYKKGFSGKGALKLLRLSDAP